MSLTGGTRAALREGPALGRGVMLGAAVLLVAAFSFGIGGYPLFDPDEGRNAEVAREMTASGDFLVPRLDGLPYLDKPMLFFATEAAAFELLGRSEWTARLPPLLFALATALATGWFARRLYGADAGWMAGIAALAAPLPLAYSRTVIFDSQLSFLLTAALIAFYFAVEGRRARKGSVSVAPEEGPAARAGDSTAAPRERRESRWLAWSALAWGAMALGVLAKGPVALAVPLLAAGPYAALRRANRAVWHPLGPAVLLAIVLPWVAAMTRQVPEFLRYALLNETWQRITTDDFQRTGPIWYFVPTLLVGALPWSALVLGSIRRGISHAGGAAETGGAGDAGGTGRAAGASGAASRGPGHRYRSWIATHRPIDPRVLYLLLWIVLPFLLFSCSRSKRPHYVLPLLPAIAVLAASRWYGPKPAGESGRLPGARAAAGSWIGFGLVLAGGAVYLRAVPALVPSGLELLPASLAALGAAALAGGLLAWLAAGRAALAAGASSAPSHHRAPLVLLALALPVAAMPLAAAPLLGEIGRLRSARALAAAIAPRLRPGAEVVGVQAFPPSLPFYLGRPLLVVSARGRELTSNYVIRAFPRLLADPASPLRPTAWWRRALGACERPWIFVVHADDAQAAAALHAAHLPALFNDGRLAAYGPCAAAAPGPPREQGRRRDGGRARD